MTKTITPSVTITAGGEFDNAPLAVVLYLIEDRTPDNIEWIASVKVHVPFPDSDRTVAELQSSALEQSRDILADLVGEIGAAAEESPPQ